MKSLVACMTKRKTFSSVAQRQKLVAQCDTHALLEHSCTVAQYISDIASIASKEWLLIYT